MRSIRSSISLPDHILLSAIVFIIHRSLALSITPPPASNPVTAYSIHLTPSPNLERADLTIFTHQSQSLGIKPRSKVFEHNWIVHEDFLVPCWVSLVVPRG